MAIELVLKVDDKGTAVIKKFVDTSKKGVTGVGKETKTATDQMKASWNNLRSSITAIKIGFLAVTASVVATGRVIAKTVNEVANYRDNLAKLSQATGISTESLAGWAYAAQRGGSSAEAITKGIRNLYRQMQGAKDGLAESKRLFDALNVSVMDSSGVLRNGEEVFMDVAEAISQLPNATEKAAVAQEVFGRSGMELVPILNSGKEGIRALMDRAKELGLTFSQDAGKAAENMKDMLLDMNMAMFGVKSVLGEFLIPMVTAFAEGLTQSFIAARLFADAIVTAFGGETVDVLGRVAKAFGLIPKYMLAGGDPGTAFARALKEVFNQGEKASSGLDKLTAEIKGYMAVIRDAMENGDKTVIEQSVETYGDGEQRKSEILFDETRKRRETVLKSLRLESDAAQKAWKEQQDIIKQQTDAKLAYFEAYDQHIDTIKESIVTWIYWEDAVEERALNIADSFSGPVSGALTDIIFQMRSMTDIIREIGRSILTSIVNALVKATAKAIVLKGAMTALDALKSATGGPFSPLGWIGIPGLATGGIVGFQSGGIVTGGRPLRGSNEKLIGAQTGEGIVPRSSMAKLGLQGFESVRQGRLPSGNINVTVNAKTFDRSFVRSELVPILKELKEDYGVRF